MMQLGGLLGARDMISRRQVLAFLNYETTKSPSHDEVGCCVLCVGRGVGSGADAMNLQFSIKYP